jgi:6-phosphogluconolactonase (cycloisomerase 2 family)
MAYVVNAGGTPNVTALRIGLRGEVLVVTEKNTNKIDLFPLAAGSIGTPSSVPSNGPTPFGFTFGLDQTLIVSEAANSTISSYRIQNSATGPTLRTITGSLADSGAAVCWIVSNPIGRLVLAINSATATISSLEVASGGALQLLAAVAATTPSGSVPIDAAFTPGGRFLYVISTSDGSMAGFSVRNGALTLAASLTGLPLSIQGIAAR